MSDPLEIARQSARRGLIRISSVLDYIDLSYDEDGISNSIENAYNDFDYINRLVEDAKDNTVNVEYNDILNQSFDKAKYAIQAIDINSEQMNRVIENAKNTYTDVENAINDENADIDTINNFSDLAFRTADNTYEGFQEFKIDITRESNIITEAVNDVNNAAVNRSTALVPPSRRSSIVNTLINDRKEKELSYSSAPFFIVESRVYKPAFLSSAKNSRKAKKSPRK